VTLKNGTRPAKDFDNYDAGVAYFSDRGRSFQRDRGRCFKLIVDAQGCAQARN